MKLIIIAAMDRNRVIGKNGKIPWHLPDDLARFKRLTTGHTVVMGRKTFNSLGSILPNRTNIVISTNVINGVKTFPSLDYAVQALKHENQVFIIGGGKVFADALKIADEMLLTIVDKEYDGDTFFPPYQDYVKKYFILKNEECNIGYRYLHYIRK